MFLHCNRWELIFCWKKYLYACSIFISTNSWDYEKSQNLAKKYTKTWQPSVEFVKIRVKKHENNSKTYYKCFLIHSCLFIHDINTHYSSVSVLFHFQTFFPVRIFLHQRIKKKKLNAFFFPKSQNFRSLIKIATAYNFLQNPIYACLHCSKCKNIWVKNRPWIKRYRTFTLTNVPGLVFVCGGKILFKYQTFKKPFCNSGCDFFLNRENERISSFNVAQNKIFTG